MTTLMPMAKIVARELMRSIRNQSGDKTCPQ